MKKRHAGLMAADLVQVPDWSKDNAAGRRILQHHDMEFFECNLHLEGGSIHTDGEGYLRSLLTFPFPFQSLFCCQPCILDPLHPPSPLTTLPFAKLHCLSARPAPLNFLPPLSKASLSFC